MNYFKLQTPDMLDEARQSKKGMNIFLEVVVFVAVFIVAELITSIPTIICELPLLFTNADYLAAVKSGDTDRILYATQAVLSTDIWQIITLFLTTVATVVMMLFCKLFQKRKMRTLGFKKAGFLREYLVGLLIGGGMFSGMVLVCVVTGALKINGIMKGFSGLTAVTLIMFFVGFMLQGMSEEVICRGYMLISASRKSGNIWIGILANSVIFAALHLGNDGLSVPALINLTLFGIFASVVFVKRGNIWIVAGIHSMWNFVQGNLWGILVSGTNMGSTVFTSTVNEKLTFINGGDFGLEGGIVTTVVLIVATGIALTLKQKDVSDREEIVIEGAN